MKISQIVLWAVLLGHSRQGDAFSGGQFKRPKIVPKGEKNEEQPNMKNEPLEKPKRVSQDEPPARTTSTGPSSPRPIVSGDRANSDRYQNSMSPWSAGGAPSAISATIGGGAQSQAQQPPPRKSKPRMSRAASAIPIISSGSNGGSNSSGGGGNDSSNQPPSFNTSGVSRGAVASMTSSAPPAGGTTVSHAAASTSGMSVGSVGSMTSSQPTTGGTTVSHAGGTSAGTDLGSVGQMTSSTPPTGGTTVSHASAATSGMSVGSVGQMTSTQPPAGGTTVTHAVVSGDRACSDRYQNSMMDSNQGNRSATYKPKPRISRAAKTIPVVGGGGSSSLGGGGSGTDAGSVIGASAPTSNTSGVSRGSIASMTTSAPVGAGRSVVSATPAADATPLVSGDRACADRYQNSIASATDPNRSSTYRGPAKVTRAAATIPKMPDGSSAGGSPWVPKAGNDNDDAAAASPKKMRPNSPRAVDESIKPIISGQVGANVNDRYGNSMTQN